jgi:hypothetical protein
VPLREMVCAQNHEGRFHQRLALIPQGGQAGFPAHVLEKTRLMKARVDAGLPAYQHRLQHRLGGGGCREPIRWVTCCRRITALPRTAATLCRMLLETLPGCGVPPGQPGFL